MSPKIHPKIPTRIQVRTLGERIHSPSLVWSYYSDWSTDLPPPGQIPPNPPNAYSGLAALHNFEDTCSHTLVQKSQSSK